MHDDPQITPEDQQELTEPFKFPFLHLFTGLILSCVSFFVLIYLFGFIDQMIDPYGGSYDLQNRTFVVVKAYAIPEGIILAIIGWLALKTYKSQQRNYMWSYICMAIINVICFGLVCLVMGSVEC